MSIKTHIMSRQVKAPRLTVRNTEIEIIESYNECLSSGNLRKWYARFKDDNKLYYIKSNSKLSESTFALECRAECAAYELGILLGMNSTPYYLDTLTLDSTSFEVCYSEDFSVDYEMKSIVELLPKIANLSEMEKYNFLISKLPYAKNEIDCIVKYDKIINNHDRHLNNISVLFGDVSISMAPVYDNGDSLFSKLSIEEIKNAFRMPLNYSSSKPFFNIHSIQCRNLNDGKLTPISKISVYRIMNKYFETERAKLTSKWVISMLKELNLLNE